MAETTGVGDPSCACNNIVIMQLFHELKQKFPAVPDRIVSECIRQNCHDKAACESLLLRENQGYLMHSYPMALKLSVAADEAPVVPPGKPCERCSNNTKSHEDVDGDVADTPEEASSSFGGGVARTQTHFYSSVRETSSSHVVRGGNDNNMNRQVVSVVRDTVVAAPASVLNTGPSVVTTGTQWFAQGATSNYLPGYNGKQQPPPGDSSDSEYVSPFKYPPQFRDVAFVGASAQYQQHVRSKRSPFTQTDVNCNPLSKSNNAQCVLQGTNAPRQCQTRSSVSVQSSTTYHKHCNRPCSLDVLTASMLDQPQPWSAPDMPTSFEPFNHLLLPSRSIEFNSPPASTPPLLPPVQQACCVPRDNQSVTRDLSVHPNRTRSSLTVEPAPHYAARNYWGGGGGTIATTSSQQQPRSYTSVNLTLRPPSLDPLPPIDIQSAGTSLTYSTSSFDPRQGFQSQLQIRIGPGGVGSVSALRTRGGGGGGGSEARPRSCYAPAIELREEPPTRAESLPDVASLSLLSDDSEDSPRDQLDVLGGDQLHSVTQAILAQQIARKNRLRRELKKEKHKLREMQREVRSMENDLAQRQLRQRAANIALPVVTTVLQKVQCLRQEIQYLQQECKKMTTEVDLSADAHVPLGETDEAFYNHIYTGQTGCLLNRHPTTNTRRQEMRGPSSPLDALDLDGPNWTCTECTFRNHPLLDKCEQCEMPRIVLAGETQDIHIHVTHHNFPARNDT